MSPDCLTDRAGDSEQRVVIIQCSREGHIADLRSHVKPITMQGVTYRKPKPSVYNTVRLSH